MTSAQGRKLVVVADDFGIGPNTSEGILVLAKARRLTGAVLLVNSPYAEESVAAWRRSGFPMEMGWHPNLTLDAPIAPLESVPSLVSPAGTFWPLHSFLKRLYLGLFNPDEIACELAAQLDRFLQLVGHPPRLVNSHQHVSLFPPVGQILHELLIGLTPRPYVRRVRECWHSLRSVPGVRLKRFLLNRMGRRQFGSLRESGFPGNDWLVGVTDAPFVKDPLFLERWLDGVPNGLVEFICHPGLHDTSVIGRDGPTEMVERRVDEFNMLHKPGFLQILVEAGYEVVPPELLLNASERVRDAAA